MLLTQSRSGAQSVRAPIPWRARASGHTDPQSESCRVAVLENMGQTLDKERIFDARVARYQLALVLCRLITPPQVPSRSNSKHSTHRPLPANQENRSLVKNVARQVSASPSRGPSSSTPGCVHVRPPVCDDDSTCGISRLSFYFV